MRLGDNAQVSGRCFSSFDVSAISVGVGFLGSCGFDRTTELNLAY